VISGSSNGLIICLRYNLTMLLEPIRARCRHLQSIASWWWAVIFGLWTLLQNADWVIDKWGTVTCKTKWAAHTTLVPFGWQAWLIGVLCTLVLALIEGSYRHACKTKDTSERERSALAEDHRNEIEKLITAASPQLVFQKWDQIPSDHPAAIPVAPTVTGQSLRGGFYLCNDGDVAHEITVGTIEIDDQLWARSAMVNRIEKGGQGFAVLWLENQKGIGSSLSGQEKWDLIHAMARVQEKKYGTLMFAPHYSVEVRVIYRDSNNVWYRSSSTMTYIGSQYRLDFGPMQHERCGRTRPS
jgi:hypothetical protein